MRPQPGDLLRIDGHASVQFTGKRALTFRVVSVCDRPTYAGWIWLTGYVINRRGNATAKREIYVQLAGLRLAARVMVGSSAAPKPACRAAQLPTISEAASAAVAGLRSPPLR
ncbi:hypothetical protein GA0074695_3390 [Micromonospora viridifaciens]|uniref:Uncharacterized protein n=1 Tax=Micromonospora viridifaciens TaxID=1881 RepID=A0A1C4XLA3_MICVI|nr:hypothetical protein [Micromonospora viridifaciens]SCF08931.1 hypothetical protein GA0074695_3390 [Micromonospora viridifaciens]